MRHSGVVFTRRTMLKVVGSTALVTLLSGFSSSCGPRKTDIETVAKHMIDVLNHPERAHEIGNLYRQQSPELQQESLESLTKIVLHDLGLDHKHITEEHLDTLPDKLRTQVRKDFADENVVVIEGFMLSKTEALLCTLAATHRSG